MRRGCRPGPCPVAGPALQSLVTDYPTTLSEDDSIVLFYAVTAVRASSGSAMSRSIVAIWSPLSSSGVWSR